MSKRDPSFDAYVLKIHEVLDRLDYYRLLGVERQARIPEIKKSFYAIAARFHPDRNRDAETVVQRALYDIFKRLNEAYRVLCDYEQRKLYDEGLAQGKMRLGQEERRPSAPKRPEDSIRSREARQFYRQAVEAFKKDNLMQAELHVRVAQGHEKESAVIESLLDQIMAAKEGKRGSP